MRWLVIIAAALLAASSCGDDSPERTYTTSTLSTTCTSVEDGATRCSGTSLQICNAGTWDTTRDCSAEALVCKPMSAIAASCVVAPANACRPGEEGQARCRDSVIQYCDGTAWADTVDCDAVAATCAQDANTATCPSATDCLSLCQLTNSCPDGPQWDCARDCTSNASLATASGCASAYDAYMGCVAAHIGETCGSMSSCSGEATTYDSCWLAYCNAHLEDPNCN